MSTLNPLSHSGSQLFEDIAYLASLTDGALGSCIDQSNVTANEMEDGIRHAISQPSLVWPERRAHPSLSITLNCKDIKPGDKACLGCLDRRLVIKLWGQIQYKFTPQQMCFPWHTDTKQGLTWHTRKPIGTIAFAPNHRRKLK